MGKIYNNLISTTSGFNYSAQQPLDDREVVQKYEDLSDLVASNVTYEGIEVYVVDDKKSYKLVNGIWQAIATEEYVNDVVDQTYNATSNYAQSGKAVAEAISTKVSVRIDGTKLIIE